MKQIIIPYNSVVKSFADNIVAAMSEAGFGDWTYVISYGNINMSPPASDFTIYGATVKPFTITPIGASLVLTYDDEIKIAIMCMREFVYNASLYTSAIIPFLVCKKNGILDQQIISSGSRQYYDVLNVADCSNNGNSYTDGSTDIVLTPAFWGQHRLSNLYVSPNNTCMAGVIVTNGTDRFLCCGCMFFIKLD